VKKPTKIIDFAAKKYARQVLAGFDKLQHESKRDAEQKRAEVERKARNKI